MKNLHYSSPGRGGPSPRSPPRPTGEVESIRTASSASSERRQGSVHIILVPLNHLLKGLLENRPSLPSRSVRHTFFLPSPRPCIQIEFYVGMGKNDRSRVPPLKDNASPLSHLSLHLNQRFPSPLSSLKSRRQEDSPREIESSGSHLFRCRRFESLRPGQEK